MSEIQLKVAYILTLVVMMLVIVLSIYSKTQAEPQTPAKKVLFIERPPLKSE